MKCYVLRGWETCLPNNIDFFLSCSPRPSPSSPSKRTSGLTERESCQCLHNNSSHSQIACLHDTFRHETAFIVWDCLGDSTLSAFWTGANEQGGGCADKLGWQGEQLKGCYCNANVILKFNHAAWRLNGNFFSIIIIKKKPRQMLVL